MYWKLLCTCCIIFRVCDNHNSLPLKPIWPFISFHLRVQWFEIVLFHNKPLWHVIHIILRWYRILTEDVQRLLNSYKALFILQGFLVLRLSFLRYLRFSQFDRDSNPRSYKLQLNHYKCPWSDIAREQKLQGCCFTIYLNTS